MKARDVMQQKVVTVTPEASLKDAVRLMIDRHVSGLPVVDDAGTVIGILSEGDLLRRVELGTDTSTPAWRTWFISPGREARNYVRSHARCVGEVMTMPVTCVAPDTDLAEVVALMEARRVKRLPVLEGGRIVGIITRRDLVRALEALLPPRDTRLVPDAVLRHRVVAALRGQRWTRRFPIEVNVQHGVIDLVGLVTDQREREGIRVIAENTPGAQGVIDHLLWIESMSGIPMEPPPVDSRH